MSSGKSNEKAKFKYGFCLLLSSGKEKNFVNLGKLSICSFFLPELRG
jgi:hypothetical protein